MPAWQIVPLSFRTVERGLSSPVHSADAGSGSRAAGFRSLKKMVRAVGIEPTRA